MPPHAAVGASQAPILSHLWNEAGFIRIRKPGRFGETLWGHGGAHGVFAPPIHPCEDGGAGCGPAGRSRAGAPGRV